MLKLVMEMTSFNSETCLTLGGQIFKFSFKLPLEISDTACWMNWPLHDYIANSLTCTLTFYHLSYTLQFNLLRDRCMNHNVTNVFLFVCSRFNPL